MRVVHLAIIIQGSPGTQCKALPTISFVAKVYAAQPVSPAAHAGLVVQAQRQYWLRVTGDAKHRPRGVLCCMSCCSLCVLDIRPF